MTADPAAAVVLRTTPLSTRRRGDDTELLVCRHRHWQFAMPLAGACAKI
jgi:hypothetical protein